jgi:SAM-dependent methyltransferase
VHPNSLRIMRTIIAPLYVAAPGVRRSVVDYGSMEHAAGPGTYRPLMPAEWTYIGCDLSDGPNVDVVMPGEYDTGLADGSADIVISGQCLEHTKNPFRAVSEMARILAPAGVMILIAPFAWEIHRFPVDCFRFCPDGMEALMENAGIATVLAEISDTDCYAMGVKTA